MPSSSPLAIASNSVTRLLKECKYYEEDIAAQRRKISELKQEIQQGNDADNAGYLLKQRERALSETETVLTSMPEKIQSARERLESSMATSSDATSREIEKAKEALAEANETLQGECV